MKSKDQQLLEEAVNKVNEQEMKWLQPTYPKVSFEKAYEAVTTRKWDWPNFSYWAATVYNTGAGRDLKNEGYEQNTMHDPGVTHNAVEQIDDIQSAIKKFNDWTEFGSSKVAPLKAQAMKTLKELQNAIYKEVRTNKQYHKYSDDLMADDEGEEYTPGKGWRKLSPSK
tara:strand:- start:676 stop:1179 length:504 start_codon:yes stop_codon:yes gene_type:complete